MAAIPFTCFAPVDDAASARRRMLQRRMRIVAFTAVAMIAGIAAAVISAYLQIGPLAAIGLLVAGCLFLFEAVRQADQRFIAPIQARCQDDYNRQIETVLGPLLRAEPGRAVERTDRVDA